MGWLLRGVPLYTCMVVMGSEIKQVYIFYSAAYIYSETSTPKEDNLSAKDDLKVPFDTHSIQNNL